MNDLIQRTLLHAAIPLSKAISEIHIDAKRIITDEDVKLICSNAQPGMVLLSHVRFQAANLFIPGFWSHGALVASDYEEIEAVTKPGVCIHLLADFCKSKDYVALYKPLFATVEQMKAAVQWAREQVGEAYDWNFELGNKAFYCFELIWAAYQAAMRMESPWELRERLGLRTVVGEDYARSADKWQLVAKSAATPAFAVQPFQNKV